MTYLLHINDINYYNNSNRYRQIRKQLISLNCRIYSLLVPTCAIETKESELSMQLRLYPTELVLWRYIQAIIICEKKYIPEFGDAD